MQVGLRGLEPPILTEYGPKPYAYTSSATSPLWGIYTTKKPSRRLGKQTTGSITNIACYYRPVKYYFNSFKNWFTQRAHEPFDPGVYFFIILSGVVRPLP